jgi:hypothetical protein
MNLALNSDLLATRALNALIATMNSNYVLWQGSSRGNRRGRRGYRERGRNYSKSANRGKIEKSSFKAIY